MQKTKQDLVDELKAEIARDPEAAKQPFVSYGERSLSLVHMLKEIEDDTELGQQLVQSYLELAAHQEEQGVK